MDTLKDFGFKVFTGLHKAIFRASKGRFGGRGFGMPVLELVTTGRKSGARRTTMLTAPIHDNEHVVIVASKGGDARHPAWFLNLRDDPAVEVTIEGSTRPMTARVATEDEKSELWPTIVQSYKGYAGYQKRTDRDIPVVILETRGGDGTSTTPG